MSTAQHPRAPTWKWDNTKGIWYWWDAKNGVKRGLDGTEVEEFDTPRPFPSIVHSPSPPFTRPGTSISGWSDNSVVSNNLLQHHHGPAGGSGPWRRLTAKDWKVAPEPLKYFLPGRVFSVRRLFAIPSGSTPREAQGTQPTQGIHGLIVVKTGILSCSVVPIVEQLATGDIEGHFEVQQHGVVYTGEVAPTFSEAEADMQPIPIKVEPANERYTLLPTARIHYGKVHNIEHSAKVLPFGSIAEAHKESFLKQFAGVWSAQLGVSLGIAEPILETSKDTGADHEVPATQRAQEDATRKPQAPLSGAEHAPKVEVRVPEAVDVMPVQRSAKTSVPSQRADFGAQLATANTPHFQDYLPLTQSGLHTPTVSTSGAFATKPAAVNMSVPDSVRTAHDRPIERESGDPEVVVNNNDPQLQAEYDRLYGRLRRFVSLHDSALEQQSVAVEKRHHFERELDAAWESLAQCLQVMDNAVTRRAEGLDAANEELDEAFRKARDRVGSAKSVQKQSAAKRQELSTAESKIRDNTKEIKDLLEWRVATKELLERMDEIKADIAKNSENASARDTNENYARQRPEVVAFDKAQQRVSMTRMQLQELEEEYEEQRRRHEIDLDRGDVPDTGFPELQRRYDLQKQTLTAVLDKEELDLQARRLECEAAGIAFQDDSLLSNNDVFDSKSLKSLSVSLREDDEGLDASSSRRQETLAHVDQWVRQLPRSFEHSGSLSQE